MNKHNKPGDEQNLRKILSFSYFSEFGFLSFYRFLLILQGSDLSRKLRESISSILVPIRSILGFLVPSYEDLSDFFKIGILNPSFSGLVEGIGYF